MINVYTIDQLQLFANAAQARILAAAQLAAVSMRAAANAKPREWSKFMKSLEPRQAPEPGEAPADAFLKQLKASGLWRSLKR